MPSNHKWAVMFFDSNNAGIDGYDGLVASGPYQNKAVFMDFSEAADHRDQRALANPSTTFKVVQLD